MSYVAEQRGNRVIANLANEGIYFVIAGLTTTRRYLREHRGDAKAFLRAFGRATHFMFQQRDEAKKILTKYAKIDDPGMLDGSLKYAHDFTEKIPLVKREGVQVVLDQEAAKNPQAKDVHRRAVLRQQPRAGAHQRRVLQIPLGQVKGSLDEAITRPSMPTAM